MKKITDLVYNDKSQLLDLYLPEHPTGSVFVYFHGGGLEGGTKELEADSFAGYLLERGVAVVSAEYRMYPEAKFPDFVEDAADAVAWVFAHIREYAPCARVYVGGSSAGGYLSMMLCFDSRYLEKRGVGVMDVAGFVHNAGQPTSHFNILRERGLDGRRLIVDETAPMYFVGLGGNEAPPMLYLVSDDDMENRYEQTVLMMSTMRHFGYDSGKIHYRLLHGKHCAHDGAVDENGDHVLGKLIYDFIQTVEG